MNLEELYYVARKLHAWVENNIVPSEISQKFPLYHWIILRDIVETPETTVQEISKRLSLAQSMVSAAVGKLREQGYVVTVPDPGDRRKVRISPSQQVRDWLLPLIRREADMAFTKLGDLKDEEKEVLIQAFQILYKRFKKMEEI